MISGTAWPSSLAVDKLQENNSVNARSASDSDCARGETQPLGSLNHQIATAQPAADPADFLPPVGRAFRILQ